MYWVVDGPMGGQAATSDRLAAPVLVSPLRSTLTLRDSVVDLVQYHPHLWAHRHSRDAEYWMETILSIHQDERLINKGWCVHCARHNKALGGE